MLRVTVCPDRLIEFTSQVLSGLYDLRATGEIELVFSRDDFPRLRDDTIWEQIVAMRVEDKLTGQMVKVAIDLIDGERMASPQHHAWADIYFKASYRETAEEFDPIKYRPFGLKYAASTTEETVFDRMRFAFRAGRGEQDQLLNPKRWAKHLITHPLHLLAGRYKATEMRTRIPPRTDFFEASPDRLTSPTIYYRTRVYTIQDDALPIDAEEFNKVNEMRVGVIRALKEHFGPTFIGGLRPTPYSLAKYPDVTMDDPWDWPRHIATSKSSLICVTTSGLWDCMDWKVPEYLAASRCMVSEIFKYDVPVPLEEGKHYLTFTKPEDSVERCARVLQDPELANRLRREGHAYYQQHVKPISIMRNCIATALKTQRAAQSVADLDLAVGT